MTFAASVSDFETYADEDFCYLTTRGRVTGQPHEIEIWFVVREGIAYLMSGGGERSDWVRNLMADENVTFRVGSRSHAARAYIFEQEGGSIRRQMAAKYQGWEDGKPLSDWAETALIVAVEPETRH